MLTIASLIATLVVGIIGGLLSLHYKTVTDGYSSRLKSLTDRVEATNAATTRKLDELDNQTNELELRHAVTASELQSIHATMHQVQNLLSRLVDNTTATNTSLTRLEARVEHFTNR
jgi:t-SNARE complex subunit (syntaxin)